MSNFGIVSGAIWDRDLKITIRPNGNLSNQYHFNTFKMEHRQSTRTSNVSFTFFN